MKLNTITTRDSYLAQVKTWKDGYKALSDAIRSHKKLSPLCIRLYHDLEYERERRHLDKNRIETLSAQYKDAQIDLGTAYSEIERIRELLPNAGTLPDHCRADTLVPYPNSKHAEPKHIASYMLALRKRGRVLAQQAWQAENGPRQPTRELVAA